MLHDSCKCKNSVGSDALVEVCCLQVLLLHLFIYYIPFHLFVSSLFKCVISNLFNSAGFVQL